MRVQSLFVDSERGIIMDKEARDHEFTETSTLESGREASDGGGHIGELCVRYSCAYLVLHWQQKA